MVFKAEARDAGLRLDLFLSKQLPDTSRSRIQSWLNGQGQKAARPVRAGEEILLHIPKPASTEVVPQNLPLALIYEDKDILVLNKQAGVVVHPSMGHPDKTLVKALFYPFPHLSTV